MSYGTRCSKTKVAIGRRDGQAQQFWKKTWLPSTPFKDYLTIQDIVEWVRIVWHSLAGSWPCWPPFRWDFHTYRWQVACDSVHQQRSRWWHVCGHHHDLGWFADTQLQLWVEIKTERILGHVKLIVCFLSLSLIGFWGPIQPTLLTNTSQYFCHFLWQFDLFYNVSHSIWCLLSSL